LNAARVFEWIIRASRIMVNGDRRRRSAYRREDGGLGAPEGFRILVS
jgi:hypothetical protein